MDGTAKPMSNTHRAVEELRNLIFSGELGPGSDHLESELADRLGMSRTPVREAALMLEAQGLVEMRPRKGLRVLALSPSDMRDIYDVLTELESLSAENAARFGYGDAEMAPLAKAIDDMDTALATDDLAAWASADDAFHAELVRLGRNSRVQAIATMMVDQVRRARALTLHVRPRPVKSNEDHRGVFEAIRSGDPAEARRIHYAHRAHAKEMLLGILEKYQFLRL
jgi:DNA-binding GntR family transcriptional regulator